MLVELLERKHADEMFCDRPVTRLSGCGGGQSCICHAALILLYLFLVLSAARERLPCFDHVTIDPRFLSFYPIFPFLTRVSFLSIHFPPLQRPAAGCDSCGRACCSHGRSESKRRKAATDAARHCFQVIRCLPITVAKQDRLLFYHFLRFLNHCP